MKVLLFGSTGLLGHNVLLTLLARGHCIVAPVRSRRRLRLPDEVAGSERLEVVDSVDFSSPSFDLAAFLLRFPGIEAVINCAGTTDMSLLRYEDYLAGNVAMSRRVLELMEAGGIGRYVHVSSANTIGYGTRENPGTEELPMMPPFADSFYARSKREAEDMLADAAAKHPGWHIVTVNPGFMVGPYDVKPSSGKLLLAGYRKPLMAAPGGGKSFVHVADVAVATVNAMTMGRSGERYLLTGEDLSLGEFYALQARECGYRQRFVTLPGWLTNVAGGVGDLLRFFGIATQLSLCNVRQLQVKEYYSHAKATRELDFAPRPVAEAIRDFFTWRSGNANAADRTH